MNKYYKNILVAITVLLSFSSCQNYLDVQPEDKLLESQIFSNPQKVGIALNGLYLGLADGKLYGDNLTLSTMDVLAQRYSIGATHTLFKLANFSYGDSPAAGIIENIWTSGYANIKNINAFIGNLDKYKGVIDSKTDSIYRGEAIAMRAMMHFDLLRMFGPRANNADSVKPSIPYYREVSLILNPILPANEAIKMVLTDLETAEKLLEKDPVITNGVMPTLLNDGNDFLRLRNYRLNYFAVKALQARVYLYRGDNFKAQALNAAMVIINNAAKFPWTTATNVNDKVNPDRVFTTEMILGINNSSLYTLHDRLFAGEVADKDILAPNLTRLEAVFESTRDVDHRYNLNWKIPPSKSYRTLYKYEDIADKTKGYRLTIPLLKLSEMYYIAAECEPNATTALGYLNTIRAKRNLQNLTGSPVIQTELKKEYQKEFFGEGQLFFYYKRTGETTLPIGNVASGNKTVTPDKYIFPLPASETQYRN